MKKILVFILLLLIFIGCTSLKNTDADESKLEQSTSTKGGTVNMSAKNSKLEKIENSWLLKDFSDEQRKLLEQNAFLLRPNHMSNPFFCIRITKTIFQVLLQRILFCIFTTYSTIFFCANSKPKNFYRSLKLSMTDC
ncbi:exported hypothetical protein [Treponema phagedenis]|uniref:Lipoprotein n=1 Tax=Treponema phagedenis TaxID=162 RepID=A0A0B7GZ05_TREPH|nr:exported hypothetical protein [Treponema phagedenis]